MNPDKFKKKVVKADGARAIEIQTKFIDHRYSVSSNSERPTLVNGLLVVFSLHPNQANKEELPSFQGRWDDAASTVDIDLITSDGSEQRAFKDGINGYSGHHTTLIRDTPRTYEVDIHSKSGRVFAGVITLNIESGIIADYLKLILGFGVDAEVIRGKPNQDQG